jgi:hypothetical protein
MGWVTRLIITGTFLAIIGITSLIIKIYKKRLVAEDQNSDEAKARLIEAAKEKNEKENALLTEALEEDEGAYTDEEEDNVASDDYKQIGFYDIPREDE